MKKKGLNMEQKRSLTDYIASGWVTGLQPDTIRPIDINGLEAATARASAERWDFDVTVIRIDTQIYRFLTAVPAGSKALEPTAEILKGSFRKLTPAEVAERFGTASGPIAETREYLIPTGLDADLDLATANCVRAALGLLQARYGMDRHLAYAYLSAATDFCPCSEPIALITAKNTSGTAINLISVT